MEEPPHPERPPQSPEYIRKRGLLNRRDREELDLAEERCLAESGSHIALSDGTVADMTAHREKGIILIRDPGASPDFLNFTIDRSILKTLGFYVTVPLRWWQHRGDIGEDDNEDEFPI